MELLQKFKDPELGKRILERLQQKISRPLTFMEVCGTHTVAISRSGIRELLKGKLRLKSGPGCPVCVTDNGDIDKMIGLVRLPGVIVTTFGDMMRVPGSQSSLMRERANGDVRVVYSPLDAVAIAEANPDKTVIFLGVGFETTAPAVALCLEEVVRKNLKNFLVYSAHKVVPPVLKILLQDPEVKIDGFLLPGHVCTILGRQKFEFLSQEYNVPAVISGFEPVDILASLEALVGMVTEGKPEVLNRYSRAVRDEGNLLARTVIQKYFDRVDVRWRGIGIVPASGLKLKSEYARYDAEKQLDIRTPPVETEQGCLCGEILKGKIEPPECPLFAKICTPLKPVGPCMVSSEGACVAYYKYERKG